MSYKIHKFDVLESTNQYALAHLADLKDCDVICAERQTAGRGRMGRTWVSDVPDNVYLSLVLKPDIVNPTPDYSLTLYTAVKLAAALDLYLKPIGKTTQIKWPNDILVDYHKISGILVESAVMGASVLGYVVGVGVNLNMPRAILQQISQPATSLHAEIQQSISVQEFAGCFLDLFFKDYPIYLKKGFKKFKKDYKIKAYWYKQNVCFQSGNQQILGRVEAIDQDGSLLVKTNQGFQKIFSGEMIQINCL